jgi:hypothetical protein
MVMKLVAAVSGFFKNYSKKMFAARYGEEEQQHKFGFIGCFF